MTTVYFFTATPRPLRFFALGYVSRGASLLGEKILIACPLIQRTNHRRQLELAIDSHEMSELRAALRSRSCPNFNALVPTNALANAPRLCNADLAVAVAQRLDLPADLRVLRVPPCAPPPAPLAPAHAALSPRSWAGVVPTGRERP